MNAEDAMHGLYRRLIDGWNAGDAGAMAGALAPDGLVSPEDSEIMPDRNSIQTVVGRRGDDGWLVALFQTTPARFDGRPELSAALTTELAELLPG